jgi:hypothetical protein
MRNILNKTVTMAKIETIHSLIAIRERKKKNKRERESTNKKIK